MIGLATVAFGLIAAGAWNKFISDIIALFLKPGNGVLAELIYAVLVTILAIVVIQIAGEARRERSAGHGQAPVRKEAAGVKASPTRRRLSSAVCRRES